MWKKKEFFTGSLQQAVRESDFEDSGNQQECRTGYLKHIKYGAKGFEMYYYYWQ